MEIAPIGIVSDSGGSYFLPPDGVAPRGAVLHAQRNADRRRSGSHWPDQPCRRGWRRCTPRPGHLRADSRRARRALSGKRKTFFFPVQQKVSKGRLENEARAMARVTRSEDAWNAMRAVLAKQKPTSSRAASARPFAPSDAPGLFPMICNDDQLAIRDLARRFARDKLAPQYPGARQIRRPRPCASSRDGAAWPDGRRPARGRWRPRSAGRHHRHHRRGACVRRLQRPAPCPSASSLLGAIIMSSGSPQLADYWIPRMISGETLMGVCVTDSRAAARMRVR